MATEATSLVSRSNGTKNRIGSLWASLKRRYQIYVYPKGAYIVSLYCMLSFTLFTNGFAEGPVLNKVLGYQVSKMYYYEFLLLLLFPFIGLIGEMFSRLKLVNIGVILIIVGKVYFRIAALFIESFSNILLDVLAYILLLFGVGLLITNIFQFGLDQFLFQSSDKLQSYIYFIFGMIALSDILTCSFFAILTKFVEYAILHWLIVATFLVLSFLLVIFLVSMCYCKKYIHIEPPPQVNPVKHIYKVMKYAWVNKYPARRSAYTYTERPSRLDLCKERYGGPFTTDEVEEVKSFWRILLVLISMFGAYSLDAPIVIAEHCYHNKLNFSNISYSHITPGLLVTVAYPGLISVGSTFLCILILRLVYVPLLSRYLPRLLTRMGMGMFLALCTSCSLTLLSTWLNEELFLCQLSAISQVLYGCSIFFTFVTTLEFIVAQSPLRMQGLLIGLWLCQFYYQDISHILSLSLTNYLWQYYAAKTVLVFLSCLSFLIVASKYEYRRRNEMTDVNEYHIIAEYHGRQILRDQQIRHTLSITDMA